MQQNLVCILWSLEPGLPQGTCLSDFRIAIPLHLHLPFILWNTLQMPRATEGGLMEDVFAVAGSLSKGNWRNDSGVVYETVSYAAVRRGAVDLGKIKNEEIVSQCEMRKASHRASSIA